MSGPVFAGGTGRSGTTVLSHLLDHHADLRRVVPTEVRFLTDPGGLIDLLDSTRQQTGRGLLGRLLPKRRAAADVTLARFIARMRTDWYHRVGRDGKVRGLRRGGMELATIEQAIEGFEDRLTQDPVAATRRFAGEIMTALAEGATRWIETTPHNAARAPGLLELFPTMTLLHVVRDGRDVAASVVTRTWGPSEMFAALEWWAVRMQLAYTALESFPADRVLTFRLEDLVLRDRDATYEQIRRLVGVEPDAGMRAFFDHEMSPERGHLGRWRSQLADEDVARFDGRYRVLLGELRDRFGAVPPTDDLELEPV